MKILCALSGVQFTCEHFPASLDAREACHPIFYIPQKRLLGYAAKWAAGELTSTDSYLLFLALLNSTDQVEFRVPAQRTSHGDSIIAQYMEDLIHIIGKINIIKHPNFHIPKFVISPETKTLETAHYWIVVWENCYKDFLSGDASYRKSRKLADRETALTKLLRSAEKESTYASSLAEWAAIAGDFPNSQIHATPIGAVNLSEYWKCIIRKCCRSESIFQIPEKDLQELIEHCEENIDHGSIFSHALMKLLRNGRTKQKNFLGFGDLDIRSGTYKLLSDEDTVEDANKLAMIQSAPTEEPHLAAYPNRLAFLKAKAKWDMAQNYQKTQNTDLLGNL